MVCAEAAPIKPSRKPGLASKMDSKTLQAYDRDAARFAREWNEQSAPVDMYELLLRYFRPGPTADIGCGAGRDVGWLVANGYDGRGYDASEALLAQARL